MQAVWNVLVWCILPLWAVSGFLDYICHRASRMEHATGARESLVHWLMLFEVALPLGLAIFFRINALLMAIMLGCLVALRWSTEARGWVWAHRECVERSPTVLRL